VNGCGICYIFGETVHHEYGSSFVFLHSKYAKDSTAQRLRTRFETEHFATKAETSKEIEMGVKGNSVLRLLKSFDYVKHFPIDPMHAFYLNAMPHFLEHMFSTTYKVFEVLFVYFSNCGLNFRESLSTYVTRCQLSMNNWHN